MPFVLPCPHCSHPLSVPEEMGGREFPCPLCSKTLTVAAVAPTISPSATPQFDFSEVEEKPLSDSPPKTYKSTVDLERVSHFLPEWKWAWRGLNVACLAVKLLIPVYILRTLANTTLLTRFGQDHNFEITVVVGLLSLVQFLIVLVHFYGQFLCTSLPENFGGWRARRSVHIAVAVPLVVVSHLIQLAIVLFVSDDTPELMTILAMIFFFAFPMLIVASCWYWIGFLRKLGSALGRYELVAVARGFMMWLWLVFFLQVIVSILELGSHGREQRIVSSCLGFCLGIPTTIAFFSYYRVLRTALAIVSRRAPIGPSDVYWDEEEEA
jgi:hypothetical protein